MPKSTGTMITRSCRDMEPEEWGRGPGAGGQRETSGADARPPPGPWPPAPGPDLLLLLWYLLPTGSYKFRLIGRRGRRRLAFLFALLLYHGGEERGRHVRQLGPLLGAQRAHEMRGDHDQELVIRLLRAAAREEFSQDGDAAEAGKLFDRLQHLVVDESGDGEALAILEDHFRLRAPLGKSRDGKTLQCNGVGVIERADFRGDFQIDGALRRDRGGEVELHAEGLEPHRDHGSGGAAGWCGGDGGIRERSARQEAGVLAFQADQVRLGQNLEQVALLQRLDGGPDIQVGAEGEQVQQVGKVHRGGGAALDRAEARRGELLGAERAD